MTDSFDEFWAAYPKRAGANPKAVARAKFMRALASGVDAQIIIGSARAYADEQRSKAGTEYIAMASTWLNQRRWEDYKPMEGKPRMSEAEIEQLFARYKAKQAAAL